MKKSFIAFLCISSIFMFSCASKNADDIEKKFEAPQIPQIENPDDEKSDFNEEISEFSEKSEENSKDEDSTEDENKIESEDSEKMTESSSDEENDAFQDNSEPDENKNSPSDAEVEMEMILEEEFENTPEQENNAFDDYKTLDEIEEPEVITLPPENEDEKHDKTANENEEEVTEQIPPEVEVLVETDTENEDFLEETNNDSNENDDDLSYANNMDAEDDEDDLIVIDDNNSVDITNDELPDSLEEKIDENETDERSEKKIVPSRKVTLKRQEYLDISYPGKGWIYMGITDGSKDLSYFGRKLGTQDTNFTLQAKNEGTKILFFTKNDALTGEYIEDYIEVEILAEKGSNKTHIQSPKYMQQLPQNENSSTKQKSSVSKITSKEQEKKSSNAEQKDKNSLEQRKKNALNESQNQNEKAIIEDLITDSITDLKIDDETNKNEQTIQNETSNSKTEESSFSGKSEKNDDLNLETLLKEATLLYNEGEYRLALNKIDAFLARSSAEIDEALYLQGQCYEAKSDVQDIKKAINSYATLTKNYPASKFWDKANKRMTYLKRFYLEAR